MDPRRLVRLRTPAAGDEFTFGSGYMVGPGRVLTAAHVLTGQGCEVLRNGADPGGWVPGRVTYHNPGLDLAVVSAPGTGEDLGWARLGRLPPGGRELRWDAGGYPVAGLAAQHRRPELLWGALPPAIAPDLHEVGLTINSRVARRTADGSGWAGLSGAAVVVEDRVVAVVTLDPPEFSGSLGARCLTAGDAGFFAALGVDALEPVREGVEELWRRCRARTASRFATLELSGVPQFQGSVPVDEVYIQLEAVPEPAVQEEPAPESADVLGAVRAFGEHAWSRTRDPFRTVEQRIILDTPENVLREALRGHRALVVLGVPGAGKSTMLRVLARWLARDDTGLVPLFGRLADLGRQQAGGSVFDLVLHDATRNLAPGEAELVRPALEAAINARHACFLLDGLDEVSSADMATARESLELLAADGHCVVVTSRPLRFQPLAGYAAHRILPLLPADSAGFVQRWFAVRAGQRGVPEAQREAWIEGRSAWLRGQLAERPQLRELAANPLLLTFLTVLAGDDARTQLPKFRRDLYREYEERLFADWEARRGAGGTPADQPDLHLAVRALHETARVLHEAYYPVGPYDPVVKPVHDVVVDAVAAALAAADDPAARGRRPGPRVVGEATRAIAFWEQAGLIRRTSRVDGTEWLLFVHQTFQEYGAACALAEAFAGDLDGLRAYLDPRLHAEGWGEVVPLTLACLSKYGMDVGPLLSHWRAEAGNGPVEWTQLLITMAYCIAEGAAVREAWLSDILNWLEELAATASRPGSYVPSYEAGPPVDEVVRALITIGWNATDAVVPVLRRMMAPGNDIGRRVRSAEAVGRLGDRPTAMKALQRAALDRSAEISWRLVAAWALGRLGQPEQAVRMIGNLLPVFAGYGHQPRIVTDALGELGTASAVRLLRDIGVHQLLDVDECLQAAVMLYRLGHQDAAREVLDSLSAAPHLAAHDRRSIGRTADRLFPEEPR